MDCTTLRLQYFHLKLDFLCCIDFLYCMVEWYFIFYHVYVKCTDQVLSSQVISKILVSKIYHRGYLTGVSDGFLCFRLQHPPNPMLRPN